MKEGGTIVRKERSNKEETVIRKEREEDRLIKDIKIERKNYERKRVGERRMIQRTSNII